MDKTEVEILAEEVDEYIKLMRLAVQSIVICPICHKKYVKGQSENGCPYCEIRELVSAPYVLGFIEGKTHTQKITNN